MKIEDLIKEAFNLKKKLEETTKEYETVRRKIQSEFDKSTNQQQIEVDNIMARKVERIKVDYKADKLKKQLPKNIVPKVIKKEYRIKDMDKLKKILKDAGVNPDKFKECIDIITYVDKIKIKQLFEIGEINKDHLQGCYDANIIKYIDIREKSTKAQAEQAKEQAKSENA